MYTPSTQFTRFGHNSFGKASLVPFHYVRTDFSLSESRTEYLILHGSSIRSKIHRSSKSFTSHELSALQAQSALIGDVADYRTEQISRLTFQLKQIGD